MIKLFCKGLPRNLSNSLFNEYNNLEKELKFLINTYYNRYKWTQDINFEYFQIFLALSVFYRRVIAQLDSAVDFSRRFLFSDDIKGFRMGNYLFTDSESQKLKVLITDFVSFCCKYKINVYLFDFDNVSQFLYKFRIYYNTIRRLNENS